MKFIALVICIYTGGSFDIPDSVVLQYNTVEECEAVGKALKPKLERIYKNKVTYHCVEVEDGAGH